MGITEWLRREEADVPGLATVPEWEPAAWLASQRARRAGAAVIVAAALAVTPAVSGGHHGPGHGHSHGHRA